MRTPALFCLAVVAACGPTPKPPVMMPPDMQPPMEQPMAQPLAPIVGPAPFEDMNPDPNIVEVKLEAGEKVMPIGARMVNMYTYNGQFPGPLLEAKPGDRVIVHFTNSLSEPTTIHWHGLRIPSDMDGNPRIQSPVMPGETFTYDFVVPEAGSFWYHPHVHANEQVEKGLYGPIVIRDDKQPRFDRERTLMLDDILLSGNDFAPFLGTMMEKMMGRFGNILLTNGSENGTNAAGVAHVGEVERWRIVNTANARTMTFKIEGAVFQVIGTDGGPVPMTWTADTLTISVGQRLDLEVFMTQPGLVKLMNIIDSADSTGKVTSTPHDVFEVSVVTPAVDTPLNPDIPVAAIPARTPSRTVTVTLDGQQDAQGNITWMINGKSDSMDPIFTSPKGETLKVHVVNNVDMEHPFHMHGQFFSVEGSPKQGLRDTVLIPGGGSVDLDVYLDNPGDWMAHCHILEHAELGMMSMFSVASGNQ
jgi:FtsP/CotA-like multicopper oxidase with cupredoxin domain